MVVVPARRRLWIWLLDPNLQSEIVWFLEQNTYSKPCWFFGKVSLKPKSLPIAPFFLRRSERLSSCFLIIILIWGLWSWINQETEERKKLLASLRDFLVFGSVKTVGLLFLHRSQLPKRKSWCLRSHTVLSIPIPSVADGKTIRASKRPPPPTASERYSQTMPYWIYNPTSGILN
jgi:hypothetical protein